MAQPNFGTFEKDGKTRVASSQAEAVMRRFQGWREVKSATPAAQRTLVQPAEADEKK